ncbi:MAG TPA: hypothetical protein VLH56_19230 [Dissulfurispiraceae bacterium]|nr:hypothetical protein [Dissulfurispiraceae bacterium]
MSRFYRHYKNGFLLEPGGILDQPAWYLDAMAEIESTIQSHERDKIREQLARNGR